MFSDILREPNPAHIHIFQVLNFLGDRAKYCVPVVVAIANILKLVEFPIVEKYGLNLRCSKVEKCSLVLLSTLDWLLQVKRSRR